MEVRLGRPEDYPELERLKLAMGYPGSILLDQESYYQRGLYYLKECLTNRDDYSDWRVLLLTEQGRPTGYLLMAVDDEHTVTHQLQALIVDYAVFSYDGLAALIKRARKTVTAYENEYLVIELPPSDQRLQLWFYRCGFRAEQTRVAKYIPKGHRGISSPLYRLRRAQADDLPFILELHSSYSASYRPAGRQVELAEIEFRFQLAYLALDFKNSLYFILEEVSSTAPAGYLFLKPGPTYGTSPSYYVYDVAIAPAFAGRGLSIYLKGAAENIAGEYGAFLYGDGSLATPLISSWHEQLGYQIDTIRFALNCTAHMLN
jgi:GNAT superfamily N-acetyltransferase